MPNIIVNRVTLSGTKDSIDAIVGKDPVNDFSFKHIVPLSEGKEERSPHEAWGTKYDADDVEVLIDVPGQKGKRVLCFQFLTVWGPPSLWFQALLKTRLPVMPTLRALDIDDLPVMYAGDLNGVQRIQRDNPMEMLDLVRNFLSNVNTEKCGPDESFTLVFLQETYSTWMKHLKQFLKNKGLTELPFETEMDWDDDEPHTITASLILKKSLEQLSPEFQGKMFVPRTAFYADMTPDIHEVARVWFDLKQNEIETALGGKAELKTTSTHITLVTSPEFLQDMEGNVYDELIDQEIELPRLEDYWNQKKKDMNDIELML